MKLPRNLLDRPAEEMARLIALVFLDQAASARRRLKAGDPEGLHDFRVGIRRIRTVARAFRRELRDGLTSGSRRRLRRLARATGDSRDLEVHQAWVASQIDGVTPRQRAGIEWMLRRVARQRKKADRRLNRVVRAIFPDLKRRIRRELRSYRLTVRLDRTASGHSAARSIGSQVQRISADLENHLAAIHSVNQGDAAHDARIRVKRLRYILEPLEGQVEIVVPLAASLKALQDVLGDLQDAEVYARQLARARRIAKREQIERLRGNVGAAKSAADGKLKDLGDPRAGLVELSRLLVKRKNAAFQELEQNWLHGRSEEFFSQLNELARVLIHGDEAPVEIERRFLLRQMPPAVRISPATRIELGWLPGVRISERVRRVVDSRTEQRFRTINAGVGSGRLEVEEEVPAPVFDHLWSLTEGRRILKRRHQVPHSGLLWEIDEFADRELVLAEVELPFEDCPVEPPEWLKPYVVREVTGEDEFSNLQLAR